MHVKKQHLELDMEQCTGSKLGKEYVKVVYCHPAYLTYMQSQSVQLLSRVWLFATPWTAARQASLSITKSWSLLKLMSTELVTAFNHLILCHPFSSRLQCFPSSGSFPMSQLFTSGGQSIGVSASASVLPMNIQDWFPLGLTGLILQSKGLSIVFSNSTVQKLQFFLRSTFFIVQLSHSYMTTGNTIALTIWTFVDRVMSLLFNMLSRLVIAFLPRSKHLLISWLQSPSAVILEPKKIKSCHCFHCFPIYLPWSDGTRCHDLSFLNVEL